MTEVHTEAIGAEDAPGLPRAGQIDMRAELRALNGIVARRGAAGLPVRSMRMEVYTSRKGRETLMVSLEVDENVFVRLWSRPRPRGRGAGPWFELWCTLGGAAPAPASMAEAFARQSEIKRTRTIDITPSDEVDFYRLVSAEHA